MHVPDGFMNVTMSAATGVISFGTLWAYIRSAKDLIADLQTLRGEFLTPTDTNRVGKIFSNKIYIG